MAKPGISAAEFARGFAQAMRGSQVHAERNPRTDSVPKPVSAESPLWEIVAFGRTAYAEVQRAAEMRRQGSELGFYNILDTVRALHWIKMRLDDDDDFAGAARQIGVRRTYAYDLIKLYPYIVQLREWGQAYRQHHGEYPSARALLRHIGIGMATPSRPRGRPLARDRYIERMDMENGRLRHLLDEAEGHEADLRAQVTERDAEIAERDAEIARLNAIIADLREQLSRFGH